MATVTLGTLRDYWKKMNDWVDGTAATTPPIQLTGSKQVTTNTHNGVSIPASSNAESAWVDLNGYNDIGITIQNDDTTSSKAILFWSNDGMNYQGQSDGVFPSLSGKSLRSGKIDIRARYVKLRIYNEDTISHTFNSWILHKF